MIGLDRFYRAYTSTGRYAPDAEQARAVEAGPNQPLFIVAGPGTGKTTCLTIRILKLILVDGVPPEGVLATTFTRKAAAELRSRILGWGFPLVEALLRDHTLGTVERDWLASIDINQVMTGTIDSICEQILRDFREPGTQPPILADEFVSDTLMLRKGLFENDRYEDPDLHDFLLQIHSGIGNRYGYHTGRKTALIHSVWDRRFHDQVDWAAFSTSGSATERRARQVLSEALEAYASELEERSMVDFTLLEHAVLERLRGGRLSEFLDRIAVVLVDEYQDTNLLQESLYFGLAHACGGALTVVGDDDQSLYRFRGATVELYSDFPARYRATFGVEPYKVDLATNYRSTRVIIQFVNDYATLDEEYQHVRVHKPPLRHGQAAPHGVPVLAMFRDDQATLARDLADFVHQVFRRGGYALPSDTGGDPLLIERAPDGGDVGDCAFLSSSPGEFRGGRDRLPMLLREELRVLDPPIEVFNPRGEALPRVSCVAVLGGLLLECLDPGGLIEDQTSGLSQEVQAVFHEWRVRAIDFVEGDPPPGLEDFAVGWAYRQPNSGNLEWPQRIPVMELLYSIAHFFPYLYDDPEGQLYLELFARQVSVAEQVGGFAAKVVTDPANQSLSGASVKELLRNFLSPIASGTVTVNEDLIEAFPRDRLSILSIHQAKGLEFPVVIVDVGSDFKTNHHAHAFKRFPQTGSPSHRLEDLLRPHSPLSQSNRPAVDRAFDDLYRQYFVAFSRPQQVLLLVGHQNTAPGGRILNVATGWKRTGVCAWDGQRPFIEI
jgi:DNA helicase II / ATP-dependent DNA helicase PcrA